MGKMIKTGIYLPGELSEELEKYMKVAGVKSKSKVIQEALRLFILERKWERVEGEVTGIVSVIYDHEVEHVDEVLTDIQHGFLDIIISALHVHLDYRTCMLAIAVRGDVRRVKELLTDFRRVKGVKLVRTTLMSSK